MAATCNFCKQTMTPEHGCTLAVYDDIPGSGPLPRVCYGDEPGDWGAGDGRPCSDCATPPGHFHHPGCDIERCPKCGGQAISCGCQTQEESDG